MKKLFFASLIFGALCASSCQKGTTQLKSNGTDSDTLISLLDSVAVDSGITIYQKKDNLVIYTPRHSRIDLVCGTMPSTTDTTVVYCAEAAFTSACLDEFKHSNICGDHVSGGIKYKGIACKRNTGAFVYYNGTHKFLYKNYGRELTLAAQKGGMGFGQEMMIHEGKRVKTKRPYSNRNEFRALCELNGKVCIIDSNGTSSFGDFISNLLKEGVTEALYLDMGSGWNYSWWRNSDGKVYEIHNEKTPYTTNWITFYK